MCFKEEKNVRNHNNVKTNWELFYARLYAFDTDRDNLILVQVRVLGDAIFFSSLPLDLFIHLSVLLYYSKEG